MKTLSDERLAEIRERAEWEYALHAGQPRNEMRGTILFLVGASVDLLDEVERLRAEVLRREIALTGLTPMGSEYSNAPEKCAQFARDARAGEHAAWMKTVKRLKESEAENERLRARNAALVEVLRSVEWIDNVICPRCRAYKTPQGHHPDCALDAALRGANE